MIERCEHFSEIRATEPATADCAECRALGESWNELRVCLTCGHVGCCEDSKHQHALNHFRSTGHPLISSLEKNENWVWCYEHEKYFDPIPNLPRPRGALRSLLSRWFAK
jgi:uncharacterized UBP type Zn finger protein